MARKESIRVTDQEHELISQAAASNDDASIEQWIYELVLKEARDAQDGENIDQVRSRAGEDTAYQDSQIEHVEESADEQTYSQLKGQDGEKNNDKNDSGKVGVPTNEDDVPEQKTEKVTPTPEDKDDAGPREKTAREAGLSKKVQKDARKSERSKKPLNDPEYSAGSSSKTSSEKAAVQKQT